MDKILIRIVNMKYQENPSSGFCAAQCEETDGCAEVNGRSYRPLYEA